MKTVNQEIQKVVEQVKSAQVKLESLIKKQEWIDDARKYAERQSKEVKKLITSDLAKVKTFLEGERKELERFQKQIPGEVKKLRDFVKVQKKEFEKLLSQVRKAGAKKAPAKKKKASAPRKKAAKKAPATENA